MLLGLSAATSLHAQSIVINEIMASNSAAIRDEDGDSPDWIELFNPTQGPIDLDGFGLSDDPDEPFKWVFPELSLEPQAFLLVFASGKGRREWLQWETVIDWGDQWRYRRGTSHPPSDWRDVEFDDSSWSRGPSGFGYADGDDATLVPPSFSVVARKTFTIADRSTVSAALLHVDYDDAFVAYLNGVEIARANIGVVGDRPVFIETALTDREAQMYQGGEPVEFLLRDAGSLIRDGRNLLAIQVHNVGIGSSDMSLIPFLTIGFRSPPSASSRGLSRHLGSTVNHLHTNFRINADGENLTLYHANGELLDVIDAGKLPPDVSLGRQPDGGAGWVLFGQSTPGAANTTDGFESVGGELSFSHLPGFHPGPFMLVLSAGEPHAAIYYTLDGSQPSQDSNLYQLPIPIRRTTAVRARALAPNAIPGKAISHTYLVNESITLPVVSLATDPANLWDPDSGIYVLGREYEPNQPHFGANFWEDWERPVHVEFFEPAGELGFALDAGMKIFGGWSRDHPQKSLSIFARSRYGAGEIDYQLFPDKPITGFESIVLRNSGNDWLSTLFRDGMMQGLLQDTDVDTQAYRPAVVFLNGVYWGILNIREKISEHFLAANRGVDPDNLDLLEFDGSVIHGDNAHYRAMMDYIARHNIHLPATLDSIRTMMDIDNFLDYQIAQIYFDNTDWPGNNIKYWRPRTPDGRWKWIVFDTDFGFGLWDPARYRFDTLEFAMEGNGPGWPNPPWSTYLLRKFLFNGSFRNEFINRFADHLNATFHPDRANRRIDEISGLLEPEIERHQSRWPLSLSVSNGRVPGWHGNVRVLKQFADARAAYLRGHLASRFRLGFSTRITVEAFPHDAGVIKLNSLSLTRFPWHGEYFEDVPIRIEAVPSDNYRFTGWSGSAFGDSAAIAVIPARNMAIVARFEEAVSTQIAEGPGRASGFSLSQNHPNPFNHATLISYDLPEDCSVSVRIYDVLGRGVATLVSDNQAAGRHRVTWDGGFGDPPGTPESSSGVYFVRVEAVSGTGAYSGVRKMLYLK